MNLEDCLPGTIVLFAQGHVGVVANPITVHGSDLPAVMLVSGECAYCEDLELAPRFLVNGEWLVDVDENANLAGGVGWFGELGGWAMFLSEGEELKIEVPFPTYAAAREAVEKAVGL